MNLIRDVAGELRKMFVGDVWLSLGIVLVVALAASLMGPGEASSLVGGAVLLIGCVAVLVASVVIASSRRGG